jgi:16S rRNA (cytidine1402-2'-O)-methyltransferase
MPGTLFIVSTPIGNLEDITLRALRVLREVHVIAAEDTRRTAGLLQHFGIPTRTLSLHTHNERARTPLLLETLARGESVALVSDAGTPVLSDPGAALVEAAVEQGVPVVPIPGPSALTAILAVSGVPLERVTFAGFPPARAGERDRWLADLRTLDSAIVLFEAPHRVRAALAAIQEALGDRWIVLARELTKVHETIERGWIGDVLARDWPERGEFTILVSDLIRHDQASPELPVDETLADEVGRLTKSGAVSTRDAVSQVADRHGLPRQAVYRALQK